MNSNLFRCSALLLLSCFSLTFAAPKQTADLSHLVVIGDSLSAGFQNYSLYDIQQVHSYAYLIATQAGVKMVLPLVPAPGVPNFLELINPGPPPLILPAPGVLPSIPRDNPLEQPTNLSVPGMTVSDALNKRPSPVIQNAIDAMANIVLGFPTPFVVPGPPQSQVEQAVALNPTTALVWVGSNDALLPALVGDLTALTPLDQFDASYRAILDAVGKTKAAIVTANIPDVTVVPYFTPAATIAAQSGAPLALVALKLGIGPADSVRPGALPLVQAILTGQSPGPLPFLCPANISGLPVSQVPCRLTATDAIAYRLAIAAYNITIAIEAAKHKAVLVDIYSLVNELHENGYQAGSKHLTTDFLGGLFSLDGVHPTNTGHAIVANQFIQTMNQKLATSIPAVNVLQVEQNDPLVFNK
jgi:hypothetical protein